MIEIKELPNMIETIYTYSNIIVSAGFDDYRECSGSEALSESY